MKYETIPQKLDVWFNVVDETRSGVCFLDGNWTYIPTWAVNRLFKPEMEPVCPKEEPITVKRKLRAGVVCEIVPWRGPASSTIYFPDGYVDTLLTSTIDALFEPPEPEPETVPFHEALAHMVNGGRAKCVCDRDDYICHVAGGMICRQNGALFPNSLDWAMSCRWILLPQDGGDQCPPT